VNIQNLNRGYFSAVGSNLRDRLGNAYEWIAAGSDYKKNTRDLRIIQAAVVTVSAIATGFTNGYAHRDRIGDEASFGLAVLIVAFVERFYFVLRHGLTTTYQAGKQRFYALLCYRAIQITMILNGAILTAYIVSLAVPAWLELWNHWSIAFHFGLALIGVQAVRDSDAVVENQMLELKAATARQDIVTLRKAAAIGSPLALLSARVRGIFDAIALSFRLLWSSGGFSKKYIEQINQIATEQYGYLDALPTSVPATTSPAPRKPGFVSQSPKAPARWI
jgi:hypothetical protein